MSGKFIVFEGIDGCGKGTQLKMLANYLFDADKKNIIVLTREPTKISPAGIEMRRRLAEDKNPRENAELYAKLYVDDRKYHVEHVIQPALNAGHIVLCDRYKYSTIAYQRTQGMDVKKLLAMHESLPVPDIIFILDVPVDVALSRIKRKKDVFEQREFMEELRRNYLELKKLLPPENIIIIDGTMQREEVHKSVVLLLRHIVPAP